MLYISLVLYIYFFKQCHSHGYLADPPARSSAWLFDSDFASCCQYYNHVEMFCGGAYYQWVVNGKQIFYELLYLIEMIYRRKMFNMW
jgi:hypothetical protein